MTFKMPLRIALRHLEGAAGAAIAIRTWSTVERGRTTGIGPWPAASIELMFCRRYISLLGSSRTRCPTVADRPSAAPSELAQKRSQSSSTRGHRDCRSATLVLAENSQRGRARHCPDDGDPFARGKRMRSTC